MTVVVPADAAEAAQFVPLVAEHNGPVYFRISRGAGLPVHKSGEALQIGKGIVRKQGQALTIFATGIMVGRSMQAAEELAGQGIDARMVEIHTIKPLDKELVIRCAQETGAVVTAEEHAMIGGLGGAVAETLAEVCPTPMQRVGIADAFCPTGRGVESLLDACGLGMQDVVSAAQEVLKRKK